MLGGMWTGLALREVLDELGVGDAGPPRARRGRDRTAPGDAPALELDLCSLERRPRTARRVAPERVWRAALDAGGRGAELARMEAIAGPRAGLVVTGGWAARRGGAGGQGAHIGPFERPAVVEAGARGAALLAGVAAGLFEAPTRCPRPRPPPGGS